MPSCDLPEPAAAFTELFHAHFHRVHVNLRRLGVPEDAVDDALQEVFIVVLRSRGVTLMSERAWILGVARRIAHRWRRGAARRRRLAEALSHEPNPPFDGTTAVLSQQAARLLETFLDRLDDDRRAVFVLAELEQLTAPEIAEALRLNLNTVYSRLRAARQAFDRSFARARLRDARSTGEAAATVLLSRARTAYAPGPGSQARALALLLPLLLTGGQAWAGSLAPRTAALVGKTTVWAGALGLIGVLAVGGFTGAPVAAAPRPRPPADDVAPVHAHAPAIVPDAAPGQRAPNLVKPPQVARTAPRRAPPPPVRAAKVADEGALRREADLLAAARAALRDGVPARAQALLDRHALEFPAGALVDERQLSQLLALCLMGQVQSARVLADRLARERPAMAARIAAACGELSETDAPPTGD